MPESLLCAPFLFGEWEHTLTNRMHESDAFTEVSNVFAFDSSPFFFFLAEDPLSKTVF